MWADSGSIAGTGEILDSGWLEGADRGGEKGAGIGTQGKMRLSRKQQASKQASRYALGAAAGREGGTGRQSPSTTTAKPPGGSAFRGLSARQNPATAAPTSHGVPDQARGFAVKAVNSTRKGAKGAIPLSTAVGAKTATAERLVVRGSLGWATADFRLDEGLGTIDLPSRTEKGLSAYALSPGPPTITPTPITFWLAVAFGMESKERRSDNPIAAKPSAPSNAVASISQSVRLEHQTAGFETPGSCPGAWCLAMLSDASNPSIMPADTGTKYHASPAAR
ncbi:hypothetical protein CPLU01_13362 [Colletotrichum plurivorum]|uniref:Uncharacterized protein n=1 Tax=Colletotrichum plurivorum TaxID=2175906 RepID=A0A8H6N2X7_9PEZI|nr:hypothetical protein CPLU01_13362 [Colletotrichum plurivorum]